MPSRGTKQLNTLMKQYPSVQLATLVDQPPEGEGWVHEIKFDGYRLLGFLADGAVCLRTRNGKDWTAKFPSIEAALVKLKAQNAVIDMEAVVLDDKGKSTFHALQAALGEGGNRDKIVGYAFDLLHLDGKNLTGLPLTDRKEKLERLLKDSKPGDALRYSVHFTENGAKMFAKACALGLEGIVSKQAAAPYQGGRERSWLKSKCGERQEFIILGYSNPRRGSRALGGLYLGYRKAGGLKYAGKVGTGFTMASARALTERVAPLAVAKQILTRAEMGGLPGAEWQSIHWIKPQLLCEVSFTEWTADGHIRHPSFQGLREDKEATDVTMEKPVAVQQVSKRQSGGLVLAGVNITHPDRLISETGRVTKGELAEYHLAVAPFMLPHIVRHPISLLRCPSGIGEDCFYQRNPGKGLGPDVHPFEFRHNGKKYEYLYIEDEKGLLELIQMGAVEIHPWGASIDAIDFPDRLIFDLDPAPDVPFEAVKMAAQDLRRRLQKKGLGSAVKCTGGKGLHVTVPLAAKDKWTEAKSFAAAIAHEMADAAPGAYIATMAKAKRSGKIFIDYLRNDYTATAIADYGVRARPGAPVAVPLDWKELDDLESANQFSMKDVLERIRKMKPSKAPRGQRIPT